jgi:hypothetical protein
MFASRRLRAIGDAAAFTHPIERALCDQGVVAGACLAGFGGARSRCLGRGRRAIRRPLQGAIERDEIGCRRTARRRGRPIEAVARRVRSGAAQAGQAQVVHRGSLVADR